MITNSCMHFHEITWSRAQLQQNHIPSAKANRNMLNPTKSLTGQVKNMRIKKTHYLHGVRVDSYAYNASTRKMWKFDVPELFTEFPWNLVSIW